MRTELAQKEYRIFGRTFLQSYIITMRPYLMFVSGITGVAGVSFAEDLKTPSMLLVLAASFLSYGFGQALTDCFQRDTDALSSPYRPLVRGLITQRQVLMVSIVGLVCCVCALAILNPLNLVLGGLAGIGLYTYTPFKRRWWAGPFYNSWIVGVLFLMATLAGGYESIHTFSVSMVAALCTVFFGYANFVLAGYFKDVEADRVTGYNTLPVVWGRRLSAWVSDAFAALGAGSALVAMSAVPVKQTGFTAGMFILAGLGMSAIAQVRLHAVRVDDDAHPAISGVVHAYLLLLTGIASDQQPTWAPWLIVYYLLFAFVLRLRPARNQI